MSRVVVILKSGVRREFKDTRPGGSYTNDIRSEQGFLVVTDVWGKEHWFPAADVETAERDSTRGSW